MSTLSGEDHRELISSPAVIDFLVKSMGYVVVPLEFVMGILVMVPRLRVAGFLLAWVFHSALVILTNDGVGLGFVGYAVLLTHVLLATHFGSIRLKLRGRDGAIGLICLLGAVALALSSGSKYAGLIWFFGLYVPLAAVYLRLMLSAQPPLELPTERWAIYVNRIWPVALVLWFIYPIAIGYRNQQFGWAMFSGASRDKVAFCATAATHPCSDSWSLYPHIRSLRIGQETIYVSRQYEHLERLKRELGRRCGQVSSEISQVEKQGSSVRCPN